MGSSLSYHLQTEETAFDIIDTTGNSLVEVIREQDCNNETCKKIAEQKVFQMCEKFSPGQLAWTCQRLGLSTSKCNQEDMSEKIVDFYASMINGKNKTEIMYHENSCPKIEPCPICPPVHIKVNAPPPIIYSPVPETSYQRQPQKQNVVPLHTIQGFPTQDKKRVQLTGEEITRQGNNLLVRNPKSIKVAQTINKSQLNDFAKNLDPQTKITSIRTIPKTQNIPRGTPVKALADHIPKTTSELRLEAGQTTTYLQPAPKNWALVRHDQGATGYVPATHLTL
jgi:hypothetical protein